jgi:hypothetical protein
MPRFAAAGVVASALAALIAACGGSAPVTPTPTPPGGSTTAPPPANNPPAITAIAVQGTRPNEPSGFADLGESIPVAAAVHDDETPVDQLEYQWSATAGTFSGTGSSVVWQAPAAAATPADVTITLKVVEHFGFPGVPPAFSNEVTGTATVSLHDSKKEVGDMARQFLLDFSDSTIRDVSYVMRNFDPSCGGTAQESQQVSDNRRKFNIVRSDIGQSSVAIPFGNAFCPIPSPRVQRGDACSTTPVHWESTVLVDGHHQIAEGTDLVAAYYRPALKAWKLCDSQFIGTCTDATAGAPCPPDVAIPMVAGSWREP